MRLLTKRFPLLHFSAPWDCFKTLIFRLKLGFLNTYPQIYFFQYYPKLWCNIRSKALYPNFGAFYKEGGGCSKRGVFHENVLRIFQKLRFLSFGYSGRSLLVFLFQQFLLETTICQLKNYLPVDQSVRVRGPVAGVRELEFRVEPKFFHAFDLNWSIKVSRENNENGSMHVTL